MAPRGLCHFCDGPVDTLQRAAWPISGWEAERGGGGANQIIGRERIKDGRIAHAICAQVAARRSRHGIAAGQQALL